MPYNDIVTLSILCSCTILTCGILALFIKTALAPQYIVLKDVFGDHCPCVEGGITNQTINWNPTPNTRGTSSILSSCILTLAISMWSAIHLNIPSKNWVKWQWAEKSIHLLWGILSPEMIAYIALEQNVAAGQAIKTIVQTLQLQTESTSSEHNTFCSRIWKFRWRKRFPSQTSKCTDIEVSMTSLFSILPTN